METGLRPRQQPRLLMKSFTGKVSQGPISQSHKSGGRTQWVRSAVSRKKHWPSSSGPLRRTVLLLCCLRGDSNPSSFQKNPPKKQEAAGLCYYEHLQPNKTATCLWGHIPPPGIFTGSSLGCVVFRQAKISKNDTRTTVKSCRLLLNRLKVTPHH